MHVYFILCSDFLKEVDLDLAQLCGCDLFVMSNPKPSDGALICAHEMQGLMLWDFIAGFLFFATEHIFEPYGDQGI